MNRGGQPAPDWRAIIRYGRLALAMSLFILRIADAADGDALRARLISEAPKGWDRWVDAMSHVDAEWEWKKQKAGTDGSQGELIDSGRRHYFYRGVSRRGHFYKTEPSGRTFESVSVRRANEYRFRASKGPNSTQFVVTSVDATPPHKLERNFPPQLLAPYCIQYVDLRGLIKDPRFEITSIASSASADGEAVRVDFVYRTDDPNARFTTRWEELSPKSREDLMAAWHGARFTSGWVELLPRNDWAVQRYRIQAPPVGQFVDQTVRYQPRRENHHALREIIKQYYEPDGKTPLTTETSIFTHCEHAELPEEFFSFTALGLPEIVPPRAKNYMWFVLVNLGIILILFALFRRARLRHARDDSMKPSFPRAQGKAPRDLRRPEPRG